MLIFAVLSLLYFTFCIYIFGCCLLSLLVKFAEIYSRYYDFRAFFLLKNPVAVMFFARWTPYQ